MQPPPSESDADQRLVEAIDGYLAAIADGQGVTVEQWAERYPDIATELRDCLAALTLLRHEATTSAAPIRPLTGYTVLEEIGRGGMGVVHRAIQRTTGRIVAVKFLSDDAVASPTARRRFEREIELAAGLDHPGIVRIIEGGESDGRMYYAMDFIRGQPLGKYVSGNALDIEQKLGLFLQTVEAVQYAHQHGVIHRDLKPGNVMVNESGQVRILDFGLARALVAPPSDVLATRPGQILGTLPYASPEQCSAGQTDVRTDIYALGVILYELLVERLPYDTSGSLDTALHHIVHTIPPRPSSFTRRIGADLDAIVLRALEKSPNRRYHSAAALAEDVRCYLRGEPVEANRTAAFYLLRKAYARHRRQVQLTAAGLAATLVVSITIAVLYVQVRRERNAVAAQLHLTELRRGIAHLAAGHDALAEDLLRRAYRSQPDRAAHWSLLSYYARNPLVMRAAQCGWVTAVSWSGDGRTIALGNLDGTVLLIGRDGARTLEFHAHAGAVSELALTAEGNELITGGADGRVRAWTLRDPPSAVDWREHAGGVTAIRPARSEDILLTAGLDGRLREWRRENGNWRLNAESRVDTPVHAADLSRDGQVIAYATPSPAVVIRTASGRPISTLTGFDKSVDAVALSRDGRLAATTSATKVSLWDARTGRRIWTNDAGLSEPRPTRLWDLPAEAGPNTPHVCWRPSLEFSDDGALLVSTGWDAHLRVWNVVDGHAPMELRAHETAIYDAAFAPNTHTVATGSIGTLRIWEIDRHPARMTLPLAAGTERACVGIAGNTIIWGGEPDGTVHVRRLTDGDGSPEHWHAAQTAITALSISADGKRVATSTRAGDLTLWNGTNHARLGSWSAGGEIAALTIAPDGSRIAAAGVDGTVRIHRADEDRHVLGWHAHPGAILAIAFSPDGRRLLTGGTDWRARFWDAATGACIATWTDREWVNSVAFSPDGLRAAIAGASLTIHMGPVGDAPDRRIPSAHAHWITAIQFLDEGRVLASGGNDNALRFWDAQTLTELATLPSTGGAVQCLSASRDGRFLAIGTAQGIQIVDLGFAADAVRRCAE